MIFALSPGLNGLFCALYALMETALLLLFLRPYALAGHVRASGAARNAVLGLFALWMALCVRTQPSAPMALNVAAHYAGVTCAAYALCRVRPEKAAFDALIFHLTADLCKMLVIDMLPVLREFKNSGSPLRVLFLLLIIGSLQGAATLPLSKMVCHPRAERLSLTQAAQAFFPAIPYLLVKYVQYRSFAEGMTFTREICMMSFGICLLALIVGVMSERAIEHAQRREQEARERLALERQRETLEMHLRRIDEINRLSHDMRNHLTALMAMSGGEEARAYIERLLPSLAPVTVLPVCGVKALDVLLSRKMDECAQAGGALIPCVDEAAKEPLSRLSAPELSVIFGNLLDNAVDAVRSVPEPGERGVVLRVALRGAFLLIRTENRYAGERSASPDEGFATTKEDANAHGFGLRSVEAAARRLGGEMSADARDGQFLVNILLPLSEDASGVFPENLPDRQKK